VGGGGGAGGAVKKRGVKREERISHKHTDGFSREARFGPAVKNEKGTLIGN